MGAPAASATASSATIVATINYMIDWNPLDRSRLRTVQKRYWEKETKTKTFSKEGLVRQEKLDPEEQKKVETVNWIVLWIS
jgi:hypothetical protein